MIIIYLQLLLLLWLAEDEYLEVLHVEDQFNLYNQLKVILVLINIKYHLFFSWVVSH